MRLKLLFVTGFFYATTQFGFSQTLSEDTGFGINGTMVNSFKSGFDVIDSVLIQPDGKILSSIVWFPDISNRANTSIARFNTDGSLDMGFGKWYDKYWSHS